MKKLYTTILAGAAALMFAPTANADLYLIGAPQGWDIDSPAMTLSETSTGVYEGSFDIASGSFMFRFYTALGDWESNSIGSQEEDNPIDITLTDDTWFSGKCVNGKGSWNYPYWTGGTIYVTVNLNAMTVVFTTDPNVEIPQPAPDMFIRGANINGQSYWDGSPAMTYDYATKTYVWTGSQLGSGFKFSDTLSWDGQYNIGSNGSPIQVGEPYAFYNGGDSGNITFSNSAYVVDNPRVVLDLNAGTVLITGNEVEQEVSLTIAGDFNDWNGNDAAYMLQKSANGNYEGTFNMPAYAKFQVVLLGSTWYGCENGMNEISLGSNASTTVNLATGYQNDFELSDWTSAGDIFFSVTVDNSTPKTLTLSPGAAGIESIGSDNAPVVIYNLQGVRVNHPVKGGIYIVNGKKVVF